LWGNRQVATEIWFKENPESTRAAQYLYRYYVADGQGGGARTFINRLVENNPGKAIFSVQALAVCGDSKSRFRIKMRRAIEDIESSQRIMFGLGNLIQQLANYSLNSKCEFFGTTEAGKLADAALGSGAVFHPAAKQGLLIAKAQLAADRGNYNLAIEFLKESLEARPTLQIAELIAQFYVQNGDFRGAREFLTTTIAEPPVGSRRGMVWKSRLGDVLKALPAQRAQ